MTSKPRAVFDTNVLISATISPQGAPRRALLYVARRGVLLASEATLEEFASRLRQKKFDPYLAPESREAFVAWYAARTEATEITERIAACRDPRDDKFLEVAFGAAADVIVSGDADLKALDPFRGIPILTPAEFLESTFVED